MPMCMYIVRIAMASTIIATLSFCNNHFCFRGGDSNAEDRPKSTPLHVATDHNQTDAMTLLIERYYGMIFPNLLKYVVWYFIQ